MSGYPPPYSPPPNYPMQPSGFNHFNPDQPHPPPYQPSDPYPMGQPGFNQPMNPPPPPNQYYNYQQPPPPFNGQAYCPPPQNPPYYQPPYNPPATNYPQDPNGAYLSSTSPPPQPTPSLYPTIPILPQRPAPPPPTSNRQSTLGFDTIPDQEHTLDNGNPHPLHVPSNPSKPWQDTPLPPNLREVWQCTDCKGVYFLQEDGTVVSPTGGRMGLTLYINDGFDFSQHSSSSSSRSNSPALGSPVSPGQTVGFSAPQTHVPEQFTLLLECPGIFRVKLSPVRGHVLINSTKDFLGVVDVGTNPCRSVILNLPVPLDPVYLQKLLTLFEEYAVLTTETGGVINTVTSTVNTAFNSATKMSRDILKDKTPVLHKNTKFLRKGTGNIARLGGSLVSKGINMISETVAPTPQEQKILEFDPRVNQLKAAISTVKESIANKTLTTVSAPRGL